jgi:hypothetical protein
MRQNLNLLRQNYCRPGTVGGKAIPFLFPLERACSQGKILLAEAPKRNVHLQEFNPSGLRQTYLDEATGAELPVFAVFNLAGDHRISFEITTDSVSKPAGGAGLGEHIPFERAQAFVRKINKRRLKAELFTGISVILGIILGPALFLTESTGMRGMVALLVLLTGAATGGLLGYVLGGSILNWFCPWQKMVISAEFDGILPKQTREIARTAKDNFDNLYLVVDQQSRWKCGFLADPRPRALDPLLIGELQQGQERKFFLIDQFELTAAEQYLADEFAAIPD